MLSYFQVRCSFYSAKTILYVVAKTRTVFAFNRSPRSRGRITVTTHMSVHFPELKHIASKTLLYDPLLSFYTHYHSSDYNTWVITNHSSTGQNFHKKSYKFIISYGFVHEMRHAWRGPFFDQNLTHPPPFCHALRFSDLAAWRSFLPTFSVFWLASRSILHDFGPRHARNF